MQHPTQRIVDTLGIPLIQEGDYHSFDDGGVECQVGELLYSLVRMLRPSRTLETGLYSGISLMYVAMALQDNQKGHAESIEYEQFHLKRSKERIVRMGLQDFVTLIQEDARKFVPQGTYDFIFLDTEPALRFEELVRFFPHLAEGGIVLIHDTPRNLCQGNVNPDHIDFESWPFGNLPEEIRQWLRSGELVKMNFPNPRGLTLFYKKHSGDYCV